MRENNFLTVLGCGPSQGVPAVGNYWGKCDSNNIKNLRTRTSSVLTLDQTNILIDTSPDVRAQLLREKIDHIDAVLYTHTHADHCHGLNDIFLHARRHNKIIPLYADKVSIAELKKSFAYAFLDENKSSFYRPYLKAVEIVSSEFKVLDRYKFIHFEQDHGASLSYGYRFKNIAYCTDLVTFPERSLKYLENLEVWILDCTGYTPMPTHACLDQVLKWVAHFKPQKTYLVNLGLEMDYDILREKLPPNVLPAYDGLKIAF